MRLDLRRTVEVSAEGGVCGGVIWGKVCRGRRAKRTEARALRAEFSERSRLHKTATKPAEFSGPNRSTQSYGIIKLSRAVLAAEFGWFGRCFMRPQPDALVPGLPGVNPRPRWCLLV